MPSCPTVPLRREESAAVRGAAAGVSGEDIAAVTHHRHEGDDPMTTAMALPGNTARTFLVHDFGSGLEGDDRFVVERFE